MKNDKKSANAKTALILFSVALVFFVGVFVKQIWFR
ncbi:MAG: cytochrome oxidase small assembly protein [Burkholderiales bacterium]|nr:cytochrome oxidase small assembly protein [Burkholderiales bacterium]